MKRLILTSSAGADLAKSKQAEIVVLFFFRFVWGPLPSPEYFKAYFGAQSGTLKPGRSLVGLGDQMASCLRGSQEPALRRFLRAL
jgi:hypothetical protein